MISKKVKINCSFKQRLNSVNVLFHLSDMPKEFQSATFLKKIVFRPVMDLCRESGESRRSLSMYFSDNFQKCVNLMHH